MNQKPPKIRRSQKGFYEVAPIIGDSFPSKRILNHQEDVIDVESTSFDPRFSSNDSSPRYSAENINFHGPVFCQEQLKSKQGAAGPRRRGRPRNPRVDIYNHHLTPLGRPIYEERAERMPIQLETDDSVRMPSFLESIPRLHPIFPTRIRGPEGPTYSQILSGQRLAILESDDRYGYYDEQSEDMMFGDEIEDHYAPSTSTNLHQPLIQGEKQENTSKEIRTTGPGGRKYIFRLVKKNDEVKNQEKIPKTRPHPPILMKRSPHRNDQREEEIDTKRCRYENEESSRNSSSQREKDIE